jgi:hypothetical protein
MDLSLTHAEQGFLIPMIHLDLPTVKIGLDQALQRSRQAGGQQVRRVSIISAPFLWIL